MKNASCPCDTVLEGTGTCQCCHPDVIQSIQNFYDNQALTDRKRQNDFSPEKDSEKK